MDKHEAFESLETIRTILERSTLFTHIAPGGLFFGGAISLAASVVGWVFQWHPVTSPFGFLALWFLAFLLALAAGLGISARRAHQQGEEFWSRKLQFVLSGFLPSFVAAAILTPIFVSIGHPEFCPGLWLVLYGLGILAVGVVLDWEFRAAAWCFLIAGTITLYWLRQNPHLALGTTFGGLHLTLGVFRLYRENWKAYQNREENMKSFRL